MAAHPRRPEMTLYQGRSLEIGWRKSTYCQAGECAEISQRDGQILLRNSQSPSDVVRLSPEEWSALVAGITAGEFSDIG
jgi:hypothetical protein